MSLRSTIYSTLNGIVSPVKVYPYIAPQEAIPPFVVYTLVFSEELQGLRLGTGQIRARVQIDTYSPNLDEADTIAQNIQIGLVRDQLLPTSYNQRNLEEYEDESKLYRVSFDYGVWVEDDTFGIPGEPPSETEMVK